jgi:hypothetical protein
MSKPGVKDYKNCKEAVLTVLDEHCEGWGRAKVTARHAAIDRQCDDVVQPVFLDNPTVAQLLIATGRVVERLGLRMDHEGARMLQSYFKRLLGE